MDQEFTLFAVLLSLLLIASFWAILTTRLLRAAIGLGITSIILTVIMYRLGSPLAAMFELSVCAGLISVIFISTISLTRRISQKRTSNEKKEILRNFWYLPVIVISVAIILSQISMPVKDLIINTDLTAGKTVQDMLWNTRRLDLLGQIVLLIAGAFGVILLFKEKRNG